MSYFAVGGNLGYALGPLITTPVVLTLGLSATPLIAIPGLIAAALITRELPRVRRHLHAGEQTVKQASRIPAEKQAWTPFWRLVAVIVMRSVPFFALVALVPIYLLRHFHTNAWLAGFALTLMLFGGAAGTLVGGRCADLFGRKKVMIGAMVPLTLLLLLLRYVGLTEFIVVLVGVGLTLEGPFSTTVLLGQEYLPGRVGLASGVTYGLAIGLGGMLGSALGALADATSVSFVISLMPIFAALAVVLTISLPKPADALLAARQAHDDAAGSGGPVA